jgi:hypothetical protein
VNRSRKVLLAVITLGIAIAVVIVVARRFRRKEHKKGSRKWARQHQDEIVAEALKAVKAGRQLSPSKLIDESRHFVRSNCDYIFPRDKHAHLRAYALWRVLQSHKGVEKKIRLSCGPMAMALALLLEGQSIKSRVVQIYSSTTDSVRGHRFLEVLNPDTGKWELQDPTYDLSYFRAGRRLATEDLVFGDLTKVEPVGWGKERGWKACGIEELREEYFHALLYYDRKHTRPTLMVVNPGRFDLAKKFSKEGGVNFPAYIRKNYPGIKVLDEASKPTDRPGG